jgi:hypothetical protein
VEGRWSRRRILGLTLGSGAGLALGGGVAARAGERDSARGGALVGSWQLRVTAASPPGLEPFDGLATFTADGSVIEARRLYVPDTPFGPLLETPGHGAWERKGRDYAIAFLFLLQGAPDNPALHGAPVGTDNVWWTARVTGDTAAGPFRSEVRDPGGQTVFAATGTVSGTRIRADRT